MSDGREVARVFGVAQGECAEDVDSALKEDERGTWYTLRGQHEPKVRALFSDDCVLLFIFFRRFRVAWVVGAYDYSDFDFWSNLLGACCRVKGVLEKDAEPTVSDVFAPVDGELILGYPLTREGEIRALRASLGGAGARERQLGIARPFLTH